MKKYCLFILIVSILLLSGCDSSFEVTGLERYNENVCSMGTCDSLMPSDAEFISNYTYEDGDFYYWSDGNYSKAKTIVWLQYSDDIYPDAKAACENYHSISSSEYQSKQQYGDFCFHVTNVWSDTLDEYASVRMFGYNDVNNTLVFIGLEDMTTDEYNIVDEQNFTELMRKEFSEYLKIE